MTVATKSPFEPSAPFTYNDDGAYVSMSLDGIRALNVVEDLHSEDWWIVFVIYKDTTLRVPFGQREHAIRMVEVVREAQARDAARIERNNAARARLNAQRVVSATAAPAAG